MRTARLLPHFCTTVFIVDTTYLPQSQCQEAVARERAGLQMLLLPRICIFNQTRMTQASNIAGTHLNEDRFAEPSRSTRAACAPQTLLRRQRGDPPSPRASVFVETTT